MRKNTPRLETESRESGAGGRVPFGMSRGPGSRVELVFALRNGGMLAVTHDLGGQVNVDTLDRYCTELRQAVAAGQDWGEFADSWGGTGQRAYIQLSEVVGFTARPAR